MIPVFDVSTYQWPLDFTIAYREGWRAVYVKLGGDNIVPRYVAPHYAAQVDQARAARFRVGHYWVPNGALDPTGAADYYTANLRGWTPNDFLVLDNESLDKGVKFTDAQAATWVKRVAANLRIPVTNVFVYIGLNDLRTNVWPQLEALGVRLIVASYGKNTGVRDHEPNLQGRFAGKWAGHQYTSNGTVAGVFPTDLNTFQDWAFDYNTPVTQPKEIEMLAFTPKDLLPGWNFLIGSGTLKNAPNDEANVYAKHSSQTVQAWANDEVIKEIWNHGLQEFIPNASPDSVKAFLQSLGGGKLVTASWLRTSLTLTAEDRAAIAEQVISGPEIAGLVADEIDTRTRTRLDATPSQ